MPRARNPLTAIFSPTRRLIGTEPVLVQRGGLLGSVEWVVPRAECHYRRVDLSALPARQRQAAARIAARREPLAPEAVSRIAWAGGIAHIWTWSPAGQESRISPAAWIPESLLRPVPTADGPRLVRLVRGVEGQVWREHRLVASQWWSQAPGLEAWHRFLRASGISPEEAPAVPDVQVLGWSGPWAELQFGTSISPVAIERFAWRAVVGGLALGIGWQLSAQVSWSDALDRLEARTQALRARAMPLLEARERADAARQSLQEYRELQQATSDFVLMAEVVKPLPEDALLSLWQREGANLKVGVKTADTDPRYFVAAYERHPLLANVQAAPAETGLMHLDFTLSGALGPESRE
jgi:nucleotide-binding universal stress UspA family protein